TAGAAKRVPAQGRNQGDRETPQTDRGAAGKADCGAGRGQSPVYSRAGPDQGPGRGSTMSAGSIPQPRAGSSPARAVVRWLERLLNLNPGDLRRSVLLFF